MTNILFIFTSSDKLKGKPSLYSDIRAGSEHDSEGNIIPSKYKSIPNPKTVYDPKVISDEQMLAWGKEAMKKGLQR